MCVGVNLIMRPQLAQTRFKRCYLIVTEIITNPVGEFACYKEKKHFFFSMETGRMGSKMQRGLKETIAGIRVLTKTLKPL